MKLVDTSVWIDFLRGRPGVVGLGESVREGSVLMHPWVLGEIALGNLGTRRHSILEDLSLLPMAPIVQPTELLSFIDHHSLGGTGLGLVDIAVMASANLAGADLVTGDRRLATAWERMQQGRSSR
ncbi:MAG: PIN domain-containing protein [Planctomycetota bacterium]